MSGYNFGDILNAALIQNILKPFVITIGTIFSAKAFYFLGHQVSKGVSFSVNQAFEDYNLVEKYGEYVVINNASDPIGMEFAKAFVEKGHSVMLIGGDFTSLEFKLREVSGKLHDGRTLTLINKPMGETDDDKYRSILERIESSDAVNKIGILFNNGGSPMSVENDDDPTFLSVPTDVVDIDSHRLIGDYLRITRDIFHLMTKNKKGLIVNMSAPTFCDKLRTALPLDLREFVENMNGAIRKELGKKEYRDVAIKVEALHPGTVCMGNEYSRCCPSKLNPRAEVYVKSAINIIGKAQSSAGYGYHGVQQFISTVVPQTMTQVVHEALKSLDGQCKPSKAGYDMIPGKRSVAVSAAGGDDVKGVVVKIEKSSVMIPGNRSIQVSGPNQNDEKDAVLIEKNPCDTIPGNRSIATTGLNQKDNKDAVIKVEENSGHMIPGNQSIEVSAENQNDDKDGVIQIENNSSDTIPGNRSITVSAADPKDDKDAVIKNEEKSNQTKD